MFWPILKWLQNVYFNALKDIYEVPLILVVKMLHLCVGANLLNCLNHNSQSKHLFVAYLNYAVSSSDCIGSNDRMINEKWDEKIWKEIAVT